MLATICLNIAAFVWLLLALWSTKTPHEIPSKQAPFQVITTEFWNPMVRFRLADFALFCQLVTLFWTLSCHPSVPCQVCVICKLNKPAFCVFIQLIEKSVKDDRPFNQSLNKYLSSPYNMWSTQGTNQNGWVGAVFVWDSPENCLLPVNPHVSGG